MQPSINPANLSPEQKDELIVQLLNQIAQLKPCPMRNESEQGVDSNGE